MIIIAFDFGTRNIGVAIGECCTYTTRPLNFISYIKEETYWKKINILLSIWNPKKIIVGLPLNTKGKKQKTTLKTEIFALKLFKKFNIKVKLHDERYTTIEAKSILFNTGGKKFLTQSKINSMAALIILNSWFNQKKYNLKKNIK
ncbi:Holliday junction resolvase RuvX [Buchnera aphidicola]|uniref:Holliday junction resolvase RuvX n=1 Tax=Buchnera aphidicola TaxID=9 RepID=UPI00223795E8|nr:Holliday junction resolvase RuvX [Buchnera aphidicola]MCW5197460.1 Holliday junction resolvase RuvX [Buchnera aphidicola (Chaitophorus viminalis)]